MKKINSFWILSFIVTGLLLMANKCEKEPEDEEEKNFFFKLFSTFQNSLSTVGQTLKVSLTL